MMTTRENIILSSVRQKKHEISHVLEEIEYDLLTTNFSLRIVQGGQM